jgi:hypothetical protein
VETKVLNKNAHKKKKAKQSKKENKQTKLKQLG